MTSTSNTVPGRRVLAMLALVTAGLALLVLVVFLVNNPQLLVLGLLGLALAVAGAWTMVTERMPRRAIGIAALVIGFLIIVGALVSAAKGSENWIVRGLLLGALLAISSRCARTALLPDLPALQVRPVTTQAGTQATTQATTQRPQHPVLICNPWSGGGKVAKFDLVARARELGVETVMLDHDSDLEQLARDAIASGADCLGMAGGDGSQALVASIAIEHDVPFVCVSAGTRNHFALDLGLDRDDPRESLNAFVDAVERRVDYATVGDRLFVNNVSLGVYATIVQEDSYREAKLSTSQTRLPEMLGRTAEPFDLQFTGADGQAVDSAFLIMVSNNPYVLGAASDIAQRRSLSSGRLGVFAVNARSGPEAARLMVRSAIGRRAHDPGWHQFTPETFEVRSRSGTAFAGIDGEALNLPTPLIFQIHPGGLRLLVPSSTLETAARREARNVSPGRLWSIVRGT